MVGTVEAKSKKAASTIKQEDCGAMMKSLIPLPTKFGELMTSAANGLEGHVAWVSSSKDPAAIAEAAALKTVVQDHREVAALMKKIVTDLETASKIAPAPHDMSKADPKGPEMMMKQAAQEKEMAALMLKHAEDTEKMVQAMKAPPAGTK